MDTAGDMDIDMDRDRDRESGSNTDPLHGRNASKFR
jgi:hypothetical protein